MRPRRRDPSRFFSRGSVEVLAEDASTRQVQLRVTVPACVLQAAFPQLLGSGLVDGYEVASPLAVWMPTVADEGFVEGAEAGTPSFVNAAARSAAAASLQLFGQSASVLRFPADLVPLLPMGVYVRCRLRCRLDALVSSLDSMAPVAGVAEFKYALASVSASLLFRWDGPPPPEASSAAPGIPGRTVARSGRGRRPRGAS